MPKQTSRSAPSCASNRMCRPSFAAVPSSAVVSQIIGSTRLPCASSQLITLSTVAVGVLPYTPLATSAFHSTRSLMRAGRCSGCSNSPTWIAFFNARSPYAGAMPRRVDPYGLPVLAVRRSSSHPSSSA